MKAARIGLIRSKATNTNSTPITAEERLWKAKVIESLALDICSEIQNSIAPSALRRLIIKLQDNAERMVGFFCFTAWLTPHVADDAEVGVYSKTVTARIYREAADSIPRLILVAAFGQPEIVRSMQSFMQQWEQAEHSLTGDSADMIEYLDEKDRGPFLYWMINERC
jgi:hypothetical protein